MPAAATPPDPVVELLDAVEAWLYRVTHSQMDPKELPKCRARVIAAVHGLLGQEPAKAKK